MNHARSAVDDALDPLDGASLGDFAARRKAVGDELRLKGHHVSHRPTNGAPAPAR